MYNQGSVVQYQHSNKTPEIAILARKTDIIFPTLLKFLRHTRQYSVAFFFRSPPGIR